MHLGMLRTGTTWLHYKLLAHPEVDYDGAKENSFLWQLENAVEDHVAHYQPYKISFTNNPMDWKLPDEVLGSLDSFATHYGLSFRNPYEYLYSVRNFMSKAEPTPGWVTKHLDKGFADYVATTERVKRFCKKPLLVMVVDDLIADPQGYFDAVVKHIGLSESIPVDGDKLNWRKYITDIEFTPDDVARINKYVDEFSAYMGRDFSHWKRGV